MNLFVVHSINETVMKLTITVSLFFSLIIGSFSAKTVDSTEIYILRLKDASLSTSQRIQTYIKLHHSFEIINPKLAQTYLEKGYDLAKKVNSYYGKAWFYKISAYNSLTRGDFQIGIYQSKAAAYYFIKNKDTLNYLESNYQAAYGLIVSSKNKEAKNLLLASIQQIDSNSYYKQQGMIYSLLSHVENDRNILQALRYLTKSYDACLKAKNFAGLYSVFTDFSAFYLNVEDYNNALTYSFKALYWVKKIKPVVDFDLATVYLNIASCYIQLHQYKKALYFIDKADVVSTRIKSNSSLLKAKSYKAQCYLYLNEIDKAEQLIKSIQFNAVSVEEQFSILYVSFSIHFSRNKFIPIPVIISQANDLLAKEEGITERDKMNYYSLCSKYYSQIKDYKNALETFQYFHELKVQKLERQKDYRLIRLQIKSIQRENKYAESQLKFQKGKVKLIQQTQQKERYYFISGIIIMCIVLSFILWSIFMYRKRNFQLAQLNLQLSNLVDEKDIVLKEVNHRVKNNFQLINSVLSIQSRENHRTNKEFITQFSERIYAMSFIHDHLFQSTKLNQIEALPFLKELLEKIHLSSLKKDLIIEQSIPYSQISMSLHELIPLGLMINELAVNSYKHAFSGMKEGMIQLRIEQHEQWIEINYSDNGIGLPNDFEKHTGFAIIDALLKKLKGTMEVIKTQGTHFKICIPIQNK
jgi:two-component sensor histidine kinase